MKLIKGTTEKMVTDQLQIIMLHSKKEDRKFLFRRVKNIGKKNLVAYYNAARIYGDMNLSACIRDTIFQNYLLS